MIGYSDGIYLGISVLLIFIGGCILCETVIFREYVSLARFFIPPCLVAICIIVFALFFFNGIGWFPNFYDSLYNTEERTIAFNTFDVDGESHYAILKEYWTDLGTYTISYWKDGQMQDASVGAKRTYIHLSKNENAYMSIDTKVVKDNVRHLLTRKEFYERIDIYLPEKDYQEFQAILMGTE